MNNRNLVTVSIGDARSYRGPVKVQGPLGWRITPEQAQNLAKELEAEIIPEGFQSLTNHNPDSLHLRVKPEVLEKLQEELRLKHSGNILTIK